MDQTEPSDAIKRVGEIRPAGQWPKTQAIDRVTLDADERRRRRVVLTSDHGTRFLLDLPHATTLHHGDGLVLDGGDVIEVVGRTEQLVEMTGPDPLATVQLAWHLGNRHTEIEIVGHALRMRRDHVLEEMAKGLGATVTLVEAPFHPESSGHHLHPALPHSHDP